MQNSVFGGQSKLSHKIFPSVSPPLALCSPPQCPCGALGTQTWPAVPSSLRQSHRGVGGSHREVGESEMRGSQRGEGVTEGHQCPQPFAGRNLMFRVEFLLSPFGTHQGYSFMPLSKLLDKVWKLHRDIRGTHRHIRDTHTDIKDTHKHTQRHQGHTHRCHPSLAA